MSNIVYTSTYSEPPFDIDEAARYAGIRKLLEEDRKRLEDCFSECHDILSYKVCHASFGISTQGDVIDLGFTTVRSADLARRLSDSESVIVFCATVGAMLDRLIAKYSRLSPSRALLLQAIGTERIEAVCELFVRDISERLTATGKSLCQRFSPGYGDLPLELQTEIFKALEPNKKIGITLGGSLLMSPTKSVSAIIGVR